LIANQRKKKMIMKILCTGMGRRGADRRGMDKNEFKKD